MANPFPAVVGAMAILVLGSAVSAAVVRSGDETASVETTTTVEATAATSVPPAVGPTTTVRRPTTTRDTAPRPATTTTTQPATTAAPTTTRPVLSRSEATRALCQEIAASVQAVVGGNTIGGGLRLARALNTYGDAADPTVVSPARRMLAAGAQGNLDASALAAEEAAAACQRLGSSIPLPRGPQCIVAPCP